MVLQRCCFPLKKGGKKRSYSTAALLTAPLRSLPRFACPAAFLVVADEAFGRQIPFAFLEKVKEEWFAKWAEKGTAALAHSLDKSFG